MGKTFCQACKKKCSGEVLRVQDKYFHIGCFKCAQCNTSLAQGGFFAREGAYYCTKDYRERWGTKCAGCGEYVEGDVVTAGEKHAFHPNCFHCQRCRQPLLGQGTKVTLVQGQALCHRCVSIPVREASTPVSSAGKDTGSGGTGQDPGACAGCRQELREGQALVALDRQWHVWCFKCHSCDTVLHGEYMGKDGVPYCEKDYQKQFGVKCAYCNRYISGKVLQAGENHHFHPTCARCTKCGDPFGDGEEMFLQGAAIWHPRCGPGPTGPNGIVNGHSEAHTPQHRSTSTAGANTQDHSERISSSASEMQNDGGILPSSTTYTGGLGSVAVGQHHQHVGQHVRRSLPDMGAAPAEPPKLYPYHLLVITNYRLPADVDRCNLERHLSDAEFEAVLHCTRSEFYRMPQWRRNDIKRRARLF